MKSKLFGINITKEIFFPLRDQLTEEMLLIYALMTKIFDNELILSAFSKLPLSKGLLFTKMFLEKPVCAFLVLDELGHFSSF